MHAVLTAVGEMHSLTDWQVSEASEEAELDDFWEWGRWSKRERKKQWRGRRNGVRTIGERDAQKEGESWRREDL